MMVRLCAASVYIYNKVIMIVVFLLAQRRHDVRPLHMEGTHAWLLREELSGNVYLGSQHHLTGQLAQRHTSGPKVGTIDGLPEVSDDTCLGIRVFPTSLHAERCINVEILRHFKPRPNAVGIIRCASVLVHQRERLLLQRVVPHSVVHARYGVIHKAHLVGCRVLGIHRDVVAVAHAVVPYHRVGHQGILVDVDATRLRGIGVGGVGGRHAVVVGDGVLQQYATLVTIDGTVARGRVVRHHAGGEYQVFRMVFLPAGGLLVVQVNARAIASRVVGEHGAMHQSPVIHIDGATILVGVVVVDE